MKYKKILSILFYLSIVLFISCNENGLTSQENDNSYFPLKVGNKWYYNSFTSFQQYDSTNINLTSEVIGKKQLFGKTYFSIKSTYFDENGSIIYLDTSYYSCSNDTLYEYMSDDNNNFYESIYAIFILEKGDKYNNYMRSTEYVITVIEKDKDLITLFYDAPQYKDEEQEITFKRGLGIYKIYVLNSGNETRLIRAEL